MPRYFTVAEANALLPTLKPLVAGLVAAWRRLNEQQSAVVELLDSAPRVDRGGRLLSDAAADIVRVQNALFAIKAHGVELKDPATGLLDFPALRDGIEVCLCWRHGEDRVAFWHPVETGFAGRRPIEDL